MELTKTTETTTNETISETKGGVYKITCTPLNKVYIGRSKNINQRKAEHFSDLRNNVHKCKEMQNDYSIIAESDMNYHIENSYFLKTLKETEDFSIYKMFIASIQKRMELTLNNVFEMNLKETIELSF